ncbi:unnamed protein product, partial [marine sediment metagenome]
LAELIKAAKSATEVYLATDMDREGEAIAWHLAESLGTSPDMVHRVIFNEITASAIREAFAHPHDIDMNKVDAQQARRILDRIVGYQVSPLLWKKIASGLSAGRVQSVAVRIIVERQRQIDAFAPQEYWRIVAVFTTDSTKAQDLGSRWSAFLAQKDASGKGPSKAQQQQFLEQNEGFTAELARWRGETFKPHNAETTIEAAKALGMEIETVQRTEDEGGKGPAAHLVRLRGQLGQAAPQYSVTSLDQREKRTTPPAPFTTASLQQAGATQLRLSAARTMRIAQQLYEGVEIPGNGMVGLITYMRTDSRHMAGEAITQARTLIGESFGQQYLPAKPNFYSSGKRAQEAHEAIRPTDLSRRPGDIKPALSPEQLKLYELIWKRMVA